MFLLRVEDLEGQKLFFTYHRCCCNCVCNDFITYLSKSAPMWNGVIKKGGRKRCLIGVAVLRKDEKAPPAEAEGAWLRWCCGSNLKCWNFNKPKVAQGNDQHYDFKVIKNYTRKRLSISCGAKQVKPKQSMRNLFRLLRRSLSFLRALVFFEGKIRIFAHA